MGRQPSTGSSGSAGSFRSDLARPALYGGTVFVANRFPELDCPGAIEFDQRQNPCRPHVLQRLFGSGDKTPGDTPPARLGMYRQPIHVSAPAIEGTNQRTDDDALLVGNEHRCVCAWQEALDVLGRVGGAGCCVGGLPQEKDGGNIACGGATDWHRAQDRQESVMLRSPIERVRQLCLALPGAWEKTSHGEPTFWVKKRMFASFADAGNHHGGGRYAVWCKATPTTQHLLLAQDPERYFSPPYVGVGGWVGVYLDKRPDWTAVAERLRGAHELAAAPIRKSPAKRGAKVS